MKLEGKAVLVTGASPGLGEATQQAEALGYLGHEFGDACLLLEP